MKKLIICYVFLFTFSLVHSQNLDLIVTNSGDSIACRTDSINNESIYFEMMQKYEWVHTHVSKIEVKEYKKAIIDKNKFNLKSGTSIIESVSLKLKLSNYHVNRYVFSPSAFGLKKGDYYYNTYNFLMHDMQYGFSESFSMGIGTTIAFVPIYFMSTYTRPINEKSAFAVGDLMMIEPANAFELFGNLVYGLYTRGNTSNNFSLGVGFLFLNDNDLTGQTNTPVFNISARLKLSERAYFVTENYVFCLKNKQGADDYSRDNYEHFEQEVLVIFGLSGVRLVGKRKPKVSWQFGLCHILSYHGDVPDYYQQPQWEIDAPENTLKFFAFPTLSFSCRFGKNY